MGASGWHYFTPYQADVGRALQDLREQVFREGRYGDPALKMFDAGQIPPEAFDQLSFEQAAAMRAMLQSHAGSLESLAGSSGPEPSTIDELLERSAEEGTHSILDISDVSDAPDFGTAFPMPEEVKLDLYVTATPTRDQVEPKILARGDELERWQCWCVIVHENGLPSEIYFEGCSGD